MSNFRKINLQLFADSGDGAGDTGNEVSTGAEGNKEQHIEPKTYTEDEITALKEQWQKEQSQKEKQRIDSEVSKQLKEQQRLSKLSDNEREEEEKKAKEKELEDREKAILFKERLSEVKEILIDKKLPLDFAEFFVSDDPTDTLAKIKEFEKTFKIALENEINARIKGSSLTLKTGDTNKVEFGKEMAQLKNSQKTAGFNPWAK
ncbi:MAG: capsid assembly scaffolding protein Gp46 family protein [Peptoanaerobacter stomatis]|uniref:capsid assembly scaffolding protein Gp46 family protein n=1 Tax=Peptoanaerobacter stomatis TaxID=796937 RepID=UPI003FA11404